MANPATGDTSVGTMPRVLILTPVKNAAKYLPKFFELLDNLDYDPSLLSIGFLESDSTDNTYELIEQYLTSKQNVYARTYLEKRDYNLQLEEPRWHPRNQRKRRSVLARSRNALLTGALRDEDYVLWLDADLIDFPPSLLTSLLAVKKEIVTAHCVFPNGRSFDLNTFKFDKERGDPFEKAHIIDGLFQPPRGHGRAYLEDLREHEIVQVDGVGGTTLLVQSVLHREGLMFPAYSHRGFIETEGLAMLARDLGIASWALPKLIVMHHAD